MAQLSSTLVELSTEQIPFWAVKFGFCVLGDFLWTNFCPVLWIWGVRLKVLVFRVSRFLVHGLVFFLHCLGFGEGLRG